MAKDVRFSFLIFRWWDDWLRHPDQRKGRACIRPEISRTFNFGKKGVSGGLFYEDHIGKILKNEKKASFVGFNYETHKFMSNNDLPINKLTSAKTFPELKTVDVRRFQKQNYDKIFVEQVWDMATEISNEKLRQLVNAQDPFILQEYLENSNLLHEDRKEPAKIDEEYPYYTSKKSCSVYEDVNSKHYCGENCRRRFRISFQKSQHQRKYNLQQQSVILKQWQLMPEIREDVARTAYLDVVTFKLKLTHTKGLFPAKCNLTNEAEASEFVIVHVAPEPRPSV
jgi:hypothetical protein